MFAKLWEKWGPKDGEPVGLPYTAAELLTDRRAMALAARCRAPEYKDPAVITAIRADTGLNSPLWAGGWGLLIPVIILLFGWAVHG